MSAAGQYVPPMIVFPWKRQNPELMKRAPPGSIAGYHESGWIQANLFCEWMAHFVKHVKPRAEDPVVLILDGHYFHTRNLDVIDFARQNFVSIVYRPPHSMHRMQPLDVVFMKPFKTFYSQELERRLASHDDRVVIQLQVAKSWDRRINVWLRCPTP